MFTNNNVNVNTETSIRYGVISGNSLDSDVLNDLHDQADCLVQSAHRLTEMKRFANAREFDYSNDITVDALYEELSAEYGEEFEDFIYEIDENWESVEPVAAFEYLGVEVVFEWLGGAPLVYITKSDVITHANLCSPCVPNAGNLDSKEPDGYECYDAPVDWYKGEE